MGGLGQFLIACAIIAGVLAIISAIDFDARIKRIIMVVGIVIIAILAIRFLLPFAGLG